MLEVTAAIIKDKDKILICQRAEDDECNLLWEFPGGKREEGETLEECIIREIQEELGIGIKVMSVFAKTVYYYAEKEIHFTFFNAEIIVGNLKTMVHKDAKWVTKSELDKYIFMPADVEIVESLMFGK